MSGTPLRVRDARPTDLELVVRFNADLARETEAKELDLGLLEPGVRRALADPEGRLRYWVVECQGCLVGQAAISREWSDWRNGWIWWLQSVYIAAEHRGQGAFRALMEQIRLAARDQDDVIGLRLYVEEANHDLSLIHI